MDKSKFVEELARNIEEENYHTVDVGLYDCDPDAEENDE